MCAISRSVSASAYAYCPTRVRQQCPEHPLAAAAQRRLQGQVLVRGHVRDQPGVQRVQRADRQRRDTLRPHRRLHLDDGVVRQERQRAAVVRVHHLVRRTTARPSPTATLNGWPFGPAAASQERRRQVHGGLRVERAATLAEQRRLLVERRVPVHLQEFLLHRGDLGGPRGLGAELPYDLVMRVEVPQVVGGDDAEAVHDRVRQTEVVGDGLAVLGEQPGQDVLALGPAEADGRLPGQVVEPDMVEMDVGRCHVEHPGELPLEADGHVAQPDGLVAGLEQRTRDDADGVGEVDDPGVRVGPPDPLGDVQNHRHGPQRLGEPTGTGGLLPDTAALQRPGLVLVPRGLPADPQLEQDGVRALHSGVDVGGGDDLPLVALLGEDPPGEPADQLQSVGGRVDEDEFGDGQGVAQPRESVDQFGGVGGAAPHDSNL